MRKIIKSKRFIFGIALFSFLMLFIVCLGPIAKYFIEKNDKELLGREVKIEKLWINLFNGKISISGLKILESDDKSTFFSIEEVKLNLSVYKLLKKEFEITSVKIERPISNIIQSGNQFNFDDIVEKLSSDDDSSDVENEASHYCIKNLKLSNGQINYTDKSIDNKFEINRLNISTDLIVHNKDILHFLIGCGFEKGGRINSDFLVNKSSLAYQLKLNIDRFNINIVYPYIKEYIHLKSMDGAINSRFQLYGNFNTPEKIKARGNLNLTEFVLTDPLESILISMKSMDIDIDSLDSEKGLYSLKNIALTEPYLIYELYDNGSNFDRILIDTTDVKAGDLNETEETYANLFSMMVAYLGEISKDYLVNDYNSDHLSLTNGHIIYNDYTLKDKFKFDLAELNIKSENLRSSNEFLNLDADAILNYSGNFKSNLQIDPKNFKNLSFSYSIKDLKISDFNPYSVHYTATPFLDGVIDYQSSNLVKNNQLNSKNDLKILTIKTGNKIRNTTAMDLPVKLAVSILRDKKGDIKIDLPVKGNLDDPKYRIGKIVWQAIKNLLIKAATAPYELFANIYGGSEAEYSELKFAVSQDILFPEQLNKLNKIGQMLKEKKEIGVEFIQFTDNAEEMDYIAINQVKRSYWLVGKQSSVSNSDVSQDSLDAINIKDSLFLVFVNERYGNPNDLISTQGKCRKIIGNSTLIQILDKRKSDRNAQIVNFLSTNHQIPIARIKISDPAMTPNNVHQNSSFFKINYFSIDDNSN